MTWIKYNLDPSNFEFCVKKKCPLRKSCLRKVTPPYNEYLSIGGNYDKTTNSCKNYINKEQWQENTESMTPQVHG